MCDCFVESALEMASRPSYFSPLIMTAGVFRIRCFNARSLSAVRETSYTLTYSWFSFKICRTRSRAVESSSESSRPLNLERTPLTSPSVVPGAQYECGAMSLAVSTSMYGENECTKTSINDTTNCLWACKHLALSTHVEKMRTSEEWESVTSYFARVLRQILSQIARCVITSSART